MKTTTGLRRTLAVLLPLTLLAAACGSDDEPAATSDPAAVDSAPADSEPADSEPADSEPADEPDATTAPAEGGAEVNSDGSTLTIAVDWDVAPRGFDGTDYASELFPFYSMVYDSLFITDTTGQVVPSLVEEFSQNEETTNLVMTLKEGAVFADGTPLDASIVKANLDRRGDDAASASGGGIANYNVFLEGEEGNIVDIEADGQVVTINFAQPTRAAHELLADSVGIVVGPVGLADPAALEAAPDGSGPYELVPGATTRGNTYAVTKKAEHWDSGSWAYDNSVFDVIIDGTARANAVISGQADIAIDIEPGLVELVRSESSISEIGGTMGSIPMLDKTGEVLEPFGFLEVRHAIGYAIDRDLIVEALVPGGRATSQMFPENAVGYDPALDDKYAYDPDLARELMASVGYEDGFEFDFTVLGAPNDVQLAVQQMLQDEINITINWVTATATEQLFASTFTQPMLISPWALGDMPAGFIRGPVTTGFMNHQGAQSEAIESVIGPALGGAPDALNALNQALTDEGWWVTMYEAKFYTGYNADTVQAPPAAGTNNRLVMSAIQPA